MFTERTMLDDNPDRVIYWVKNEKEAIYMGTVTHAGVLQRGTPHRGVYTSPRFMKEEVFGDLATWVGDCGV